MNLVSIVIYLQPRTRLGHWTNHITRRQTAWKNILNATHWTYQNYQTNDCVHSKSFDNPINSVELISYHTSNAPNTVHKKCYCYFCFLSNHNYQSYCNAIVYYVLYYTTHLVTIYKLFLLYHATSNELYVLVTYSYFLCVPETNITCSARVCFISLKLPLMKNIWRVVH